MEPAVTGEDTSALLSAAVVSSEAQPRPACFGGTEIQTEIITCGLGASRATGEADGPTLGPDLGRPT